ncbi:hypothetical protein C2I36_13755, partial [Rhodobacteraceae bacterium WD3A24]
MHRDDADPKGLMRESFRIESITAAECRSVFLDWALSLPDGVDQRDAMRRILDYHGAPVGHPMTDVLLEGLGEAPPRRRRG